MEKIRNKPRSEIAANKTQICNALYRTLRHTLIDAVEQFYQFRFESVCAEVFSAHNEIAEAVNFCIERLEGIREILVDILSFEKYPEPPMPCSDNFAKGYKQGFQDGLSSLIEFAKQRLQAINELADGRITEPDDLKALHDEIPLLGAWLE